MNIKDFTEDEIEQLHRMMNVCWDNLGADMLQVVAESQRRSRYAVTMPREDVIEVVLDAGYIEMDVARGATERALMKRFRQLSYEDQNQVAQGAFPYENYGY